MFFSVGRYYLLQTLHASRRGIYRAWVAQTFWIATAQAWSESGRDSWVKRMVDEDCVDESMVLGES